MVYHISYGKLSDFLLCEQKHYVKSKLGLIGKDEPFMKFQVELLETLRTIIKSNMSKEKAISILQSHISTIDRKWFTLNQEMEQHKLNLSKMYFRFLDYFYLKCLTVVASDIKYSVQFRDIKITSKADFIFKTDSGYEAVKFKLSSPTLSSAARIEENKPENNLDLALMYEGLREGFNNLRVSYYHLVNKDDTCTYFVPVFNEKPNQNIVSILFSSELAHQKIRRVLEAHDLKKAITFPDEPFKKNKDECRTCNYKSLCMLSDSTVKVSFRKRVITDNNLYKKKVTNFNPKQLKAINYHKGTLRLFASAGTGKTAVLCKRFDSMLNTGISPDSILVISFSRKAVDELKQRISLLTGLEDYQIQCFTYNGFCSSILMSFGSLITYNDQPLNILSTIERKKFIKSFLEKIPAKPGISYTYPLGDYGIITKMDKIIERMLDIGSTYEVISLDSLMNLYKKYDNVLLSLSHECAKELVVFMKINNYITYHDQILLVSELFKKFHYIPLHYANRYQYIMCDEYQDTDPAQSYIIYSIAQHHNNICICGDDSQSIYKFRGADNSNIIQFHKNFKECVDIFLNLNYRSNSEIVDLGESIISKNINRVPKEVKAVKNASSAVSYTQINSLDTFVYIVKDILRNSEPRDIAIIARTNSTLNKIHAKLNESSIPAKLNQSGADNNVELLRIINFLSVVFDEYSDVDKYVFRLINDLNETDSVEGFASNFWDSISNLNLQSQLSAINDSLLMSSNVVLYLNELINIERINTLYSLFKRLVEITDYKDNVPLENELTNEITLITSHSSKGKEYDYVIIPDICEFVDKDDMEEARRVLFVAVTRAKIQVYVCSKGDSEFTQDVLAFLNT